ncbi:dockerin type I domain-containing protein [Ruminococcus sp.]|uniref:dockerin type I domain-containing protein n=1 Tax=Ruminococcus sp. TaxID=41978 RepID=UPI003F11F701
MRKLKKPISMFLTLLMIFSIVPVGNLAGLDMSWLSPEIKASAATGDKYEAILSWGGNPSDLDSHITGPTSSGGTFHVYYQNKNAYDDNQTVATLDQDVTSGYGPETVTLYPVNNNNRYTYYVYNYSGSGTIPTSNAKIDLYKNGNLIKTFSPPSTNSSGRTWTVFAIQNGQIYTINTISDKMNATSGTSKSTALSATKNDIVITPKGRLVAELESIFFNKKVNATLTDVDVTYNSTANKTTSAQPSFTIPADDSITEDMVLSKDDFRDYRIPKKVLESWKKQSAQTPVSNSAPQYQHDAYMTQKVKDGNPYISTVFGRTGNTAPFEELTTKSLKIKGDVDYEIQISAGDLNGADCTYYLQQDQTHVISNKTGIFTAADGVHEKLDRGKKTYAVVKTADGKRSDYEEVNIEIEATTYLQKAQDYLTPGTKLNLLGDDFAKLTVPSNLPLVGGAEISFEAFQLPAGFEFDVEEGSLKISIGANIFESSKNKGDKKYSKEMFSNWKDLTKQSISQSVQDKKVIKKQYDTNKDVFMDKWGTGKMPSKSSKNWGVSALGYIEIVFNENGYVVKEACITVEGEFSFKYNVQAGVGPIPVYFYVEAGAALGGTALGVNPVEENVQLNLTALEWDFSIKLEPKIKAGGGAGIKDFASVGIYAKATMPITFAFKQKHLTMDLNGEFGVEAELWLLKGSLKLLDGTVHVIDKYWDSSGSQKSRSAGNLLGQSNANEVVYSLVDRDYANNTSAWLGGKQQHFLKSGSSQKMVLNNLQTSVYPNAVPQVVAFGDKLLMAWIEDAADRDDYNRMRLMYSVYSNGVWSQPAAVYDNGNNDNLPVIVSDGTDIYFAWQKQASIMNADSDNTFTTIMSDVELYTAKYNAASQTIGDISRVTENNCYDYAQQLSIINGKPVLYWVSCNDSQPLETGNNTLHRMELGKNEQILEDNLNFVLDLDAAVVNGTEEVSFATDKDGNYDITDDVTVFTYSNGTLSEFAKQDDTVAYPVLFYGNPAGQTTLFVSDMTNIYYSDNGTTKAVLSESVPIEGNLQFVGNANKDMLIWTQTEEKGNAIYSSSFENGEWTSPISISNSETALTDVHAVMYRDGISGVCTSTALTYDNETESYHNDSTNLCAFNINDTQDLALEEISIDERDISIGEAAPFTVRVSNLGCGVADSVTFTVTDDLGSEYTQTVDMQLRSGESRTVTLNYTAPENYQKTFLHVTAAADGFSENDTDNNTIKQEIGIPKLMIKQSGISKIGSEYILNALVTNESDIPLDSAVLKLCNGYEGTEEINFAILTDVAARSTQLVEFSIPEELLNFDSSGTAIVSMEIKDDVASSNKESVLIDNTNKECAHPETSVRRTEPTCTDSGTEYVYCDACGELISETGLQPLGHDVHDSVCSRCENVVTTLNYGELTPVEYREGSNSVIFSFVPDETKDYYFYSDSSIDPYVTLYDSNMIQIGSNDDGGDGYNFLITRTLEKDKTYYFYVSNPSSSQKYYVTISDSFTSSHSYTTETVLPTCEEEGYTKHTCQNCGYIYSDNYVQPLGHNVQNGQCADCGRAIGTLNVDQYAKATMTSEQPDALFMFIPEIDGEYYFYSDSTADTYGTLYNDKLNALTNNDDGGDGRNFKISYTLEKDKIYYLKARFLNSGEGEFFVKVTQEYTSCHNYEIQTIPPTCTEQGYDLHKCTVCGTEDKDNYTEAKGHNVQNGQCTDCGRAIGTLNVDQYAKATMTSEQPDALFMFIPEIDGEYYFYSDSTADTYGTLYNDKLNALTNNDDGGDGRNFKISYTLEKDKIYYLKARFLNSGEGEFFVKVTQEYTSCHNYEIQTIPPTCTEQGYDLKKCTVCGMEEKDNYVDSLNQEHQYMATIVRPTCSERGYTVYHCSLCNHEYISDYIAKLPHTIVDNQCVVCGKSGAELYESNHPYSNNTNQDWVIHKDNAKSIEITFSEETETESNCDYIYIYDKDQNEIGCYSGTQLSGKTIKVEGDTATIRLVTDGSVVYYGFSLTDLKINYGVVGDSNLNGKIDIKDATAIQRHLANIEVFNDIQLAAADVNADGTVSIKDATLIQMYCAEIVDSFNGTGNSEVTEQTTESETEPTTEAVQYFPACDSSYSTISTALASIGVDNSKAYRTQIAAANGITNYTGTAEQNMQMLNLLKQGKLIVP